MANKVFCAVAEALPSHSVGYSVGSEKFVLGVAPQGNSSPAVRMTPIDLLVCALCGCLEHGIVAMMEEQNCKLESFKMEAEAVPSEKGIKSGLGEISLKITFGSPEPLEHLQEIVAACEKKCPVRNSLSPAVKVNFSVGKV